MQLRRTAVFMAQLLAPGAVAATTPAAMAEDRASAKAGQAPVVVDDTLTYFADTKIGPLGYGQVKNLYPRGS